MSTLHASPTTLSRTGCYLFWKWKLGTIQCCLLRPGASPHKSVGEIPFRRLDNTQPTTPRRPRLPLHTKGTPRITTRASRRLERAANFPTPLRNRNTRRTGVCYSSGCLDTLSNTHLLTHSLTHTHTYARAHTPLPASYIHAAICVLVRMGVPPLFNPPPARTLPSVLVLTSCSRPGRFGPHHEPS